MCPTSMAKTACVTYIARELITQYLCTIVTNKSIHSLSLSIMYNDKHVNQRHKLSQFDRMKVIDSQNINNLSSALAAILKMSSIYAILIVSVDAITNTL